MLVTPAAEQPSRRAQAWLTYNVRQNMQHIDAIVAALQKTVHPYAEEICGGLKDGSVLIHDSDLSPLSCAELHSTYTFRSRDPESSKSAHGRRLKEECLQLAAALAAHMNEKCYVAIFEKNPNICFGLFVLEGSLELLGCTRSYDRRKTSEADWKEIWAL